MFTETPLADEVIVNLDLDPRIPDSCDFVDVKVNDGWVTLKDGTVTRCSCWRAYLAKWAQKGKR